MADTKTYLGIEIGGSKLQLVLGDENARILERYRFTVDRAAGAQQIRQHIADTVQQLKHKNISAIGVGYGGPIDRVNGNVLVSYHIKGWSGFPIKNWLEELSGVPVAVDNDANVAAFGEAFRGAGQPFNNVFYITIGSGLGSGIVLDRQIYHGAFPGEAEMGHVRLDKTGRTVESSCSGWAVDKKIREAVEQYPDGELAQLIKANPGAEAKQLSEALKLNDPQALQLFDDTCDDLSFGLSHAVHLLHPEVIILGGGLSLMGNQLSELIEQKLPVYLMDVFRPGPPIILSTLKEDAVPVGALLLAISHKNL